MSFMLAFAAQKLILMIWFVWFTIESLFNRKSNTFPGSQVNKNRIKNHNFMEITFSSYLWQILLHLNSAFWEKFCDWHWWCTDILCEICCAKSVPPTEQLSVSHQCQAWNFSQKALFETICAWHWQLTDILCEICAKSVPPTEQLSVSRQCQAQKFSNSAAVPLVAQIWHRFHTKCL